MPLRDHFRPPVDNLIAWESFHLAWPVAIVDRLRRLLPRRYRAVPGAHSGASAEIDVATYESETGDVLLAGNGEHNGGGVATAVWAPARPTLSVVTDLPAQDHYEVRIYDEKRQRRLVAAVELVSPANKDRPESRSAFITKCAALLAERVSVVIVDVVTTRTANLYGELLESIGQSDPTLSPDLPLYAAACRMIRRNKDWVLESWAQSLVVGQALPTLPLWLAENLAVPLELEASYEQSCAILNIP